jgi:regulator of sigma E protease
MTIIWATILILGVLITIHEFGHFIAARSVGIRVERFSIGIPPRFVSLTSINDGWLFHLFFYKRSHGRLSWQPVFKKIISKPGRIGDCAAPLGWLCENGGYY